MKLKKYLYTTGEFAKLTGVNKRTLHYYNDIGLFCPEIVEENGYHYYHCVQFAELEFILTLRRVGLSIDEIREYVARPSGESFSQVMEKKKKLIDDTIKRLMSAQAFLERKAERVKMGEQSRHASIELCSLPERRIILSAPITGMYNEEDFSVAAEFSLRLKKLFHLYDNFGSRICVDNIRRSEFDRYGCFFAYCPDDSDEYDEILPAGKYLRSFCVGDWGALPEVYDSILAYAREHGLRLRGYAYEEGLNEMAIKNKSDYVTMISVRCE